ncbi:hypothetical protein QFZ82_001394 [Streptomyces sp. V4I23]|nr:hypothetical protein [Streptomyces sp. V4I23]
MKLLARAGSYLPGESRHVKGPRHDLRRRHGNRPMSGDRSDRSAPRASLSTWEVACPAAAPAAQRPAAPEYRPTPRRGFGWEAGAPEDRPPSTTPHGSGTGWPQPATPPSRGPQAQLRAVEGLRSPEAADRWAWLVIAAYAQLRLARPLAADLQRPWEKPAEPNRLTPARVRRGFRHIRTKTGSPAGAPKPTRPGPGRPPGSKKPPGHPSRCGPGPRHCRGLYSPVPPQESDEASANCMKQQLRAQVRRRQGFSSAE